MANEGLDILTRHRYLRHLTESEGVPREQAMAFLDVLAAALSAGEPEGEAMRDQVETRIALVRDFSASVEAAGRADSEMRKAGAAKAALERIAAAGGQTGAEAVKAYADRTLATITAKRAG